MHSNNTTESIKQQIYNLIDGEIHITISSECKQMIRDSFDEVVKITEGDPDFWDNRNYLQTNK